METENGILVGFVVALIILLMMIFTWALYDASSVFLSSNQQNKERRINELATASSPYVFEKKWDSTIIPKALDIYSMDDEEFSECEYKPEFHYVCVVQV